jgi:hypothetical protein
MVGMLTTLGACGIGLVGEYVVKERIHYYEALRCPGEVEGECR